MDPVCPLDYRYGRKEIKTIFGEQQRLQYLLDVEAALARAHATVGNIPEVAADEITKKSSVSIVTVERVSEIEKETKHDIMAVTRALAEQCNDEAGKFVHLGATSYDIVDTANALQFMDATSIISQELKKLRAVLIQLIKKHRKTVMVGRTHGQHTIPITFGLKMAGYAMEVDRHLERLHEVKSRVLVGKLSGAVGTGAALGEQALQLQSEMLKELHLGIEDVSTQIVCRDRYIELFCVLANIATSMEKFSTEIRNLQRDEIREVAEAFDVKKQVGSSTMPHKKNPITSEQVSGLSRLIRGFLTPGFENAVQWHERDLCNSSNERFMIPHMFILTDWVIFQMTKVFSNLQVYPDRMKQNMQISLGLPMAEAVMTALIKKGMGRGDAHELMRTIAHDAAAQKKTLEEMFLEKTKNNPILSEEEVSEVVLPKNYLGATDEIIDRVLVKLERR